MALSKILPASQAQYAGARNLIINSAMQVAQRGTSSTGITTSGYKTVDRFKTNISSLGTYTQSQSTSAPNGFAFSLKMDCTTADASPSAGDYLNVATIFEGQNLQLLKKGTSDALQMTLSFWVKSAKTGTYIVEFNDTDNSRSTSQSYTISSANTWENKTITVPADTTGTLTNDENSSLEVIFWLAAGSNLTSGTLATVWESRTNANRAVGQVNLSDSTSNDWYITGVQLEVGEQATPFEHRSFGDELQRCERYYEKAVGGYLQTTVTNAGYYGSHVQFRETKRASPTVTRLSDLQTTNVNGTPFSEQINEQGFRALAQSNATSEIKFATIYSADAEL
jgi:hypothetical protein